MAYVERAIGGAGTGKTRLILDRLSAARRELGLGVHEIGFCTFTRAGRAEIAGRAAGEWGVDVDALTGHGWFKTAHAIAYKQAGVEEGQLIQGKDGDKFVSDSVGGVISTRIDGRGERQYIAGEGGDQSIPQALKAWELARSKMTSVATILSRWELCGEQTPSISEARRTIEKYENAKRAHGMLDFTDVIAKFAGVRYTVDGPYRIEPEGEVPEGLRVLAIDEAQDSSTLVDMVCKRLAASPTIERIWICGDPYQCQPAGTPVLTLSGYKNIEDLDPAVDRLVTFNRRESRFPGSGSEFEIASREVDSSSLIEITLADGTKHVCTDNHKWVARTRGRKGTYATYLMAKGVRWRVGTVQVFAGKPSEKNGSFRLKMRMNQEAADAAWILKIFDTDRDARCYEQIVSCRYGIPQVTFRPPCGVRTNLDEGYIEQVFNSLGDLTKNGLECLRGHCLSPEHPMCRKADRCKNGPMASRLIHAANLIPGIHRVPKMGEKKKCEWVDIVSCRRLPPGKPTRVWSMNVQQNNTYVTQGGVVTGNSIHSFAGGDYTHFMSWEAQESTMQRSYRCPRRVLDLGEACLRQMTKGYRDRKIQHAGHDGTVSRVGSAEEALSRLSANTSALILGRCAFALEEYELILKAKNLPYLWIDKTSGSSTLSGYAALWGLQNGRTISGDDWANAVQAIAVKSGDFGELLVRGTKTAWKSGKMSHVDLIRPVAEDYELIGVTPALAGLIAEGRWHLAIEAKAADRARLWLDTANRYGEEIATNPPIRLSTIHGAKGLEADTVILSSITSPSVERARNALPELHDEECRVAYVAVTRAKQDFMLVDDGYRYRMELPL